MEPDNAFNEIFSKKPSTEQNTDPQNSQEDVSAIKEQSEAVPQAVSGQQPMQEEREPDTAVEYSPIGDIQSKGKCRNVWHFRT